MGPSEEVVYFLSVVEAENVLSTGMDKFFINVVHDVVEDDVPEAYFLVIIEIFDVVVDVLEDFLQVPLVLGLVFEWELEHELPGLDSVKDLKDDEHEEQCSHHEQP